MTVAAFLDRDDAFHDAADRRLRQLAGRETLIVSVITYAELLIGAGLGHHDRALVRSFFGQLVDEIHAVDRSVAERAAELRSKKRSLRMPDALILATADLQRADLVLTGDDRWSMVDVTPRIERLLSS